MPIKSLLSAAFLFISVNLLAQTKFVPGYTVSHANDTIRCLIKYEDWTISPDKLEVKQTENQSTEVVSALDIIAFHVEAENQTYLSKKIGVLDIDLNRGYKIAPSQETLDSTVVFLRLITSGPKAILLEYLNAQKEPHYFLQTSQGLKELINYPFYRSQGSEKYLLKLEQYKWQLPLLLSELNPSFQVPEYSEKALRKFVNDYNDVDYKNNDSFKSKASNRLEFDIGFAAGLENSSINNIKNKATFGVSIRANLPRRFHNRYLKIGYMIIPGVTGDSYGTLNSNVKLQSVELGIGSYFGSSRFRPSIGFDIISPIKILLNPSMGPHLGISYQRRLTLDISRFANFFSIFTNSTNVPFLNKPRISMTYYYNLNRFFGNK
jgi:hypothetical protein